MIALETIKHAGYCIQVGKRDWLAYILRSAPLGWYTLKVKTVESEDDAEIEMAREARDLAGYRWFGALEVRDALTYFPPVRQWTK